MLIRYHQMHKHRKMLNLRWTWMQLHQCKQSRNTVGFVSHNGRTINFDFNFSFDCIKIALIYKYFILNREVFSISMRHKARETFSTSIMFISKNIDFFCKMQKTTKTHLNSVIMIISMNKKKKKKKRVVNLKLNEESPPIDLHDWLFHLIVAFQHMWTI